MRRAFTVRAHDIAPHEAQVRAESLINGTLYHTERVLHMPDGYLPADQLAVAMKEMERMLARKVNFNERDKQRQNGYSDC